MKLVLIGKQNWSPEDDDEKLKHLHAAGLADEDIAQHMGFTKSVICRHRLDLGLKTNGCPVVKEVKREVPVPVGKKNPLAMASLYLGSRLKERQGAYWVDGMPVNLTEVMRATNRVLQGLGLEQVTHSQNWRV